MFLMKHIYFVFVVLAELFSCHASQFCQKELRHRNCPLLPSDLECGRGRPSPRIVGGSNDRLGAHPWVALLHHKGATALDLLRGPVCGGSIINRKYVLSAAHCFNELLLAEPFDAVRVGEFNINSTEDCFKYGEKVRECAPAPQTLDIDSVVFPPDSDEQQTSDIALIRLKQNIHYNDYVSPVCLPMSSQFKDERLLMNKTLEVVGWGYDIWLYTFLDEVWWKKFTHPELQVLRVPYMSWAECLQLSSKMLVHGQHVQVLGEDTLCAGGRPLEDSCEGDSGGPLTGQFMVDGSLRSFLVGIVSFGSISCVRTHFPGFYTNVSHFSDWILDNLRGGDNTLL